jgi:hypothetical protein
MVTGTMEVGTEVWRGLLRSKMAVSDERMLKMGDEALDDKNEDGVTRADIHKGQFYQRNLEMRRRSLEVRRGLLQFYPHGDSSM